MPREWRGRWKGGRYYLDARGQPVYVIERRAGGKTRALTLETHDEDFAVGELARFEADPDRYALTHDHMRALRAALARLDSERKRQLTTSIRRGSAARRRSG